MPVLIDSGIDLGGTLLKELETHEVCRLSIVTSTFSSDRLGFLRTLLTSIVRQSWQDFETVVIVDGQKELYDKVLEIIQQISPPRPMAVCTSKVIGASASRNLGAQLSSGDIIGFVDDDVILDPHWAHNVITTFDSDARVSALVGSAYPRWEKVCDAWLPTSLFWIISCSGWFHESFSEVRNMWTNNAAIRSSVFRQCKGFSIDLGPLQGNEAGYSALAEDLEFSLRLRAMNHKIFFVPTIRCRHHVRHSQLTIPYIINRSIWIGRTRKSLRRRSVNLDVEHGLVLKILREPLNFGMGRFRRPFDPVRKAFSLMVSTISVALAFLLL